MKIGVDVGGTKCLGVAVDTDGVVVAVDRRPTPHGTEELTATVCGLARALAEQTGFDEATFGVGLPGSITRHGVLTSSPHLPGVTNFDAGAAFSSDLGRPVAVTNDATCAVLAEWHLGAGRGVDNVVMITMGTGIGGGVIADGMLLLGANGYAGEFGHMMIDPNGPSCPCGQRGCWERYASGSAVALEAKRLAADGMLEAVVAQAGSIEAITSELVVAAAARGDADAVKVLDHFAYWMAAGLANLTNAFDPACFVLGGGLSEAAPVFEPMLRQHVAAAVYASNLRPQPEIRFAELGERAGAIGAALYGATR
ncbi:ROK family protein [Desertimonas flava]|uniref:ROK family protein n=1 Tax=Desertimonas flava TaxID=2064846 RepID=UPI000E353C0F|nr:ROK family protein [Desertimonas flava]